MPAASSTLSGRLNAPGSRKPPHSNAASKTAATTPRDDVFGRPTLLHPTDQPLQQSLLNAFMVAFPVELNPNTVDLLLQPLLQELKHHLYERDFDAAFSRADLLRAYAVRWSASRALAYLDVFRDIIPKLTSSPSPLAVTCLGGGAGAEVVALAGLLSSLHASNAITVRAVEVTAVDAANWSTVLGELHHATTSASPVHGIGASDFSVISETADVLDARSLAPDSRVSVALASSHLVTLMFTLNELYSTSISRAQKLLLDLTHTMTTGSLLLVVDSPGSYSTVGLGANTAAEGKVNRDAQKQRKYPMSWLLDHALLKTAAEMQTQSRGKQAEAPWEKLDTVESRWFRLPDGLEYPIPLENMRYQLHLFRRRP